MQRTEHAEIRIREQSRQRIQALEARVTDLEATLARSAEQGRAGLEETAELEKQLDQYKLEHSRYLERIRYLHDVHTSERKRDRERIAELEAQVADLEAERAEGVPGLGSDIESVTFHFRSEA